MSLLLTAFERYPKLPFACVILDAGYDAEEFHRDIYTEFNISPIIIRKPSMKWGPNLGKTGTPTCSLGYPTKRKGIEYNRGRTKFACYRVCIKDPQRLPFPCKYQNPENRFGWITHTYFKDDYRRQGPAVPGARLYEQLKKFRTGIERYYGLTKENRYHMEANNTYMGHQNVLIHVIEHDIVATWTSSMNIKKLENGVTCSGYNIEQAQFMKGQSGCSLMSITTLLVYRITRRLLIIRRPAVSGGAAIKW